MNRLTKFILGKDRVSFTDIKKILLSLARYSLLDVFGPPRVSTPILILIYLARINCIAHIIQNIWGAYYYRAHFLMLLNFINNLMTVICFGVFQFSYINRPDRLAKINRWCERQSVGKPFKILENWNARYQEKNERAWRITIAWFVLVHAMATTIVSITGSILNTWIKGEYTSILPNFIPPNNELNWWLYIVWIIQPSAYLFYVAFPTGLVFLTFFFGLIYLGFRYETIGALTKKLGEKIDEDGKPIDKELFVLIVELQVDATE